LPGLDDPAPHVADADGDGIVDGRDVEHIQSKITGLPVLAFGQGGQGYRQALLSQLDQVETRIAAGDVTSALKKLGEIRKHIDGCGTIADRDDWIIDCSAQRDLRRLIDLLIAQLTIH